MKRRVDIESEEIPEQQSPSSEQNVNGTNKKKKKVFPYGNYDQYYGYRNPSKCDDPRLLFIPKCWIKHKAILDIGCNTGHLTLSLARSHRPAKIDAIDIDDRLVGIARRNIVYYQNKCVKSVDSNINNNEVAESVAKDSEPKNDFQFDSISAKNQRKHGRSDHAFNSNGSCNLRGSALADVEEEIDCKPIRDIVKFTCSNYALKSDDLLDMCKEEYDVIMMLSVSKWIHLNFGDESLRRCFQRIFRQLRQNGIFLLEPQPFDSYRKKKNLTPQIAIIYPTIKFFPEHFHDYLISIGFTWSVELKRADIRGQSFDKRSLVAYIKGQLPSSCCDQHNDFSNLTVSASQ